MIDLTPLDVRKKRGDFRQKLRGYDPEEVDTFLELVEGRLEALVREGRNLTERIQTLESRLETLEGREEAVQDALVSAQALRKQVQEQAQKDADALEERYRREMELQLKEAEMEIESRLREAEDLLNERRRALEDLERDRRKFLKSFRSLLERELDSLEVEEARRPLEDVPLDLRLRGWKAKEKEAEGGALTADDSPGPVPDRGGPVTEGAKFPETPRGWLEIDLLSGSGSTDTAGVGTGTEGEATDAEGEATDAEDESTEAEGEDIDAEQDDPGTRDSGGGMVG